MEFQTLYAKVEANQGRSSSQVIALLRQARTSRVADSTQSEVATKWGVHALEVHRAALGDEIWSVYEQVLLAALGQNDQVLADKCADALDARFSGSARVRRLLAMRDEASGDYEDAEEVYGSMLEDNPANALVFKRRVAILRAQGKLPAAAQLLNEYLLTFATDEGAWQQLASMHLAAARYEAAAFCYEELILAQPGSHLYHCRLAEIYYTIGGKQLLPARKHFAQSLELKRTSNARALHGLCSCCFAISVLNAKDRRQGAAEMETNTALHEWAMTALRQLYTEQCPALLPTVEGVLETQTEAK